MSIRLSIDASVLSVGQIVPVTIQTDNAAVAKGITYNNEELAHLHIFNESGVGFDADFKSSSKSFFIPAGGWPIIDLMQGEIQLTLTVAYVIPNAPVSMVVFIYYFPNEPIVSVPVLGNSPVGVGGSVSTVGNTLVNNTSAPGVANIIDVGNTTTPGVTTLDTSGDFVNGNATFPGTVKFDNDLINSDGSGNMVMNTSNITGKKINDGLGNNLLDFSATGVFVKTNPSSGGTFSYQNPNGTTVWSRSAEGFISGTGNGSTGTGVGTPTVICPDPCTVSGSSQTIGFTIAATTVVTTGSGLAWKAICIKS